MKDRLSLQLVDYPAVTYGPGLQHSVPLGVCTVYADIAPTNDTVVAHLRTGRESCTHPLVGTSPLHSTVEQQTCLFGQAPPGRSWKVIPPNQPGVLEIVLCTGRLHARLPMHNLFSDRRQIILPVALLFTLCKIIRVLQQLHRCMPDMARAFHQICSQRVTERRCSRRLVLHTKATRASQQDFLQLN